MNARPIRAKQAHNQLGTPGGAQSALRGAQFFKVYPIFLSYGQHIFQGGRIKFYGGFAPPGYGPGAKS